MFILPLVVAAMPHTAPADPGFDLEYVLARNTAIASGPTVPFNWSDDALDQAKLIADMTSAERSASDD